VLEFDLEYLELVDPLTLKPLDRVHDRGLLAIAGRIENTRLIDNITLSAKLPS
jgi:pantoate ligase / CMP/dCMP kinase